MSLYLHKSWQIPMKKIIDYIINYLFTTIQWDKSNKITQGTINYYLINKLKK